MRVAKANSFRGRFTFPGDKSLSHRVALLGAMAEGETRIGNFSTAADCSSTLACLEGLGVPIERIDDHVTILGRGPSALAAPAEPLDAGNSGSTLRMLAGVLAGRPFRSVLTGDASLRGRPVERVAAPLRAMGASVATTGGKPPLTIDGGRLHGIRWDSPIASAQVKTAVLLAGVQAAGETAYAEPNLSRDHTERLLPVFGVPVRRQGLTVVVPGNATLTGTSISVPGDVSSAAFLVVAALVVADSWVRIDNVLLNPTRTAFLEVLQEMGARLEVGIDRGAPEPVGWIEARSSDLRGVDVTQDRVPALIDEIPALAVAAVHARGRSTVSGAAELRVKESDRIAAVAQGLRMLGCDIEERADGFVVQGGRILKGGSVSSWGDHRIAMALAVAGLTATGQTEIEGAECASVSFPEFFPLLTRGVCR